jgi:hypothetical protein
VAKPTPVEAPENFTTFTFYVLDMEHELQMMDLLKQVFATFTYEAGNNGLTLEQAQRAMIWFLSFSQSRINDQAQREHELICDCDHDHDHDLD